MKPIISLLGIATALTMSACTTMAHPYSNYSSASGYYSYEQAPQNMVMRPYHSQYVPQQRYTMGPQYYRVSGVPCGSRVRNYSDAPLIVERRDRNGRPDSIVIPANEY